MIDFSAAKAKKQQEEKKRKLSVRQTKSTFMLPLQFRRKRSSSAFRKLPQFAKTVSYHEEVADFLTPKANQPSSSKELSNFEIKKFLQTSQNSHFGVSPRKIQLERQKKSSSRSCDFKVELNSPSANSKSAFNFITKQEEIEILEKLRSFSREIFNLPLLSSSKFKSQNKSHF